MEKLISCKNEEVTEQGKFLRLPCEVGDPVWDNDLGMPFQYIVTRFSIGKEGLQMHYQDSSGSIVCKCAVSEIGKTVFLTRQQAREVWLKDKKNRKDYDERR